MLAGLWKGQLTLPDGAVEVTFRIEKTPAGTYYGTLIVPRQKVSLVTIEQRGDTVRLTAEDTTTYFQGRMAAEGKQLEGTWHQPGLQQAMVLAFSPVPVLGTRNALAPPYREEEVTFSNPALKPALRGTLTIPAGVGPFPAVVLLSDAGLQDRNGTVGDFGPLGQLADYLARFGVVVLRFDDRGLGEGAGTAPAPLPDLVGDAQAGLGFLRGRPEVNQARLGLIGHGEGGNVALLAAAQPQPPKFVVALAAYGLPGRELVTEEQTARLRAAGTAGPQLEAALQRQRAMLDIIQQTANGSQAQAIVANILKQSNPDIDNAVAQSRALEMTSASYRYFLGFNPADKLAGVACPVLLLNGAADTAINADDNLGALSRNLKHNKSVTVRKLAGVNHQFQPEQTKWPLLGGKLRPIFSAEAQDAIQQWLAVQPGK